jgi:hypothetical protein
MNRVIFERIPPKSGIEQMNSGIGSLEPFTWCKQKNLPGPGRETAMVTGVKVVLNGTQFRGK